MNLLKQLFCKHNYSKCLTNFHGDYIDVVSTLKRINRSAWKCSKCGKIGYSEYLDPNCKVVNWNLIKK